MAADKAPTKHVKFGIASDAIIAPDKNPTTGAISVKGRTSSK